jgi:hypothetical protein
MAFSSTVQPSNTTLPQAPVDHSAAASLLSMLVLSVYAAQKSKKAMRRMKRKFFWTALKLKFASLFSKLKRAASDRTLLYILIGVLLLALLLIDVVVGLIVLLAVLILYLLGVLNF